MMTSRPLCFPPSFCEEPHALGAGDSQVSFSFFIFIEVLTPVFCMSLSLPLFPFSFFYFIWWGLLFRSPFGGIILALCSLPLFCDFFLFFHFCLIFLSFFTPLFLPYTNIFSNPRLISLFPLLAPHSVGHSRSFFPSLFRLFHFLSPLSPLCLPPLSPYPPTPLPLAFLLSPPCLLPLSSAFSPPFLPFLLISLSWTQTLVYTEHCKHTRTHLVACDTQHDQHLHIYAHRRLGTYLLLYFSVSFILCL